MINFEHHLPTRFVFGRGVENKTGEYVRALGATKVLIHYGGGSAVRSGLIARVEASLDAAGVKYVSLGGAQPNPRDTKVYEGIELIRREKVDFVLAVGGGSAIDSAKAMAHGALYDGDFWDFFCGKAKPQKSLPKGVVLTMSAAGSESSDSCVITQEATKTKRGLNTELNRPLLAIMDPELTMTLPPYQIACGATDILAHIMERYFTNEPDVDMTDRLCESVLKTILKQAPVCVQDPTNSAARAEMMWASPVAHNDFLTCFRVGDWASHQLAHELSGLYDSTHGAALAVVFPAWMTYVYKHDIQRFCRFAVEVMGVEMDFFHPEETAIKGIAALRSFFRSIGMPTTLKELGVPENELDLLASKVKRGPDGTTGKFVPLTEADCRAIYELMK